MWLVGCLVAWLLGYQVWFGEIGFCLDISAVACLVGLVWLGLVASAIARPLGSSTHAWSVTPPGRATLGAKPKPMDGSWEHGPDLQWRAFSLVSTGACL